MQIRELVSYNAASLWAAVVAIMMFFAVHNGCQIYLASYHSEKAFGRVIGKSTAALRGTRSPATIEKENIIGYTYEDEFGSMHENECKVEPQTWTKFEINNTIPIEYLKDVPSVSYIDTSEEDFSRLWKEVVIVLTTVILMASGLCYYICRRLG